jgi:DNA-binding protein YbaB
MADHYEESMNRLKAEFDQAVKGLDKMQESLDNTKGKARSKSRMVSAMVDGRGDVTELKFHTQAWRTMSPGELSKVIIQTINDARAAAQRQMWSSVSDLVPDGPDLSELLTGQVKWSEALSDMHKLPRIVEEFLAVPDSSAPAGDSKSWQQDNSGGDGSGRSTDDQRQHGGARQG